MQVSNNIKTIWPNALALSHAVAHFIVTESNKAISKKGYCTIALSGGNTPKLLFQLLAQQPYKNNIAWKKILVAFGDERFVAPTSEDSNFKMASNALLNHVPIAKKNILAVKTINITPAQSAQLYEQQLKKQVSKKKPFDIVLLGIGQEGHTASIFPNSSLITEKKHCVKNVWVKEKKMNRISFTLPFINEAKNIVFLVSGKNKAAIIKKIFLKKDPALPAAMIQAKENTYWFLDKAAANEVINFYQ